MITVEELIVQSLYHRLVLVTVRRTNTSNSSAEHSEGANEEHNSGGAVDTLSAENGMPDKGLGFLYLGPLGASNDPNQSATSDSSAIAKMLQTDGESVQVTRHVQTVLDAGELQLVRSSAMCSAECQTDFEPMWCLSSLPSVESCQLTCDSPLSRGLLDMRNCEQFTIARLENIRDPSAQSFVMVQSTGTRAIGAGDANDDDDQTAENRPLVSAGSTPSPSSSGNVGNATSLFIGNNASWKRELELNQAGAVGESVEWSDYPANIDSGIWDMVQALGSTEDGANQVDLFKSASNKNDCSEIRVSNTSQSTDENSSGLTGTYRMYSLGETPQSEMVQTAHYENINIVNGSGRRKEHGGGLSDALEPVAAVDFIVHRVEADAERFEKVTEFETEHGSQAERQTTSDRKKMENRDKVRIMCDGKPVRPGEVEYQIGEISESASGKSVHSTDISSEDDTGTLLSDGVDENQSVPERTNDNADEQLNKADLKSSDKGEKLHKNVLEITSVRLARRSTKRRTAGRYKYWKESHMKSRKTKSADTSPRCSSMIDVGVEPHGLSVEMGSLSLAHSTELLDDRRQLSDMAVDTESSGGRYSRGSNAVHHQQQMSASPCSSWPKFGRSTRNGSGNLSVSSLDWLADSTLPGIGRAPSAPVLDLYAEPDLLDFEKFPNWMKELPEILHTVPLSDLCIPGSHIAIAVERDMRVDLDFSKCNYEMAEFLRKLPDLALFNNFRALMKNIWRTWMPKQCLTLYDQMIAGSRYLDMRITKYSNELYGEHGLYTRPLKAYLREVRRFVEEHTSEVVILHFQGSDYLDRTDKRHLVTTLFQSFGARMACSTSTVSGSLPTLPTLQQMWSTGKQIIIFFPSADIELICNHIFGGLVWSDDLVRLVASPKTQTVADLIRSLDSAVPSNSGSPLSEDIRATNRQLLNVVKAVLSPDMSMVFGRFEYRSMRELVSYETAGAVSRWLDDKMGGSLNVVVVDFIGVGDVVKKILSLNDDLAKRLSC